MTVAEELEEALQEAFKSERLHDYYSQFRASSLPFCPRELVLQHRFPEEDRPLVADGFYRDWYTSLGHAAHSVMQRWIAPLLFGNWTCCEHTIWHHEGPPDCGVCGRPMAYEEYQILSEMGGHSDGVIKRFNAIFELKSSSIKALARLTEPYWWHWAMQGSVYATALNREFGWQLDKVIMMYVARDNPRVYKVFVMPVMPKVYDSQLALFRSANKQLENPDLPEGICSTPNEGNEMGCPYAGVCFSPALERMLTPVSKLVKEKPDDGSPGGRTSNELLITASAEAPRPDKQVAE